MMAGVPALPRELAIALDRASDRLGAFEQRVRWFGEVDSTNDLALNLAASGAPEGTVVVADAQRRGRGRRGRTWFSPAGAGLYVSAVLRAPDLVTFVPLASGLAVAEGIGAATGLHAALKWPNDVFVPGPGGLRRKLAGVLVEAAASPVDAAHLVVGFGVNVLSSVFPPDVADRGTTLETELGRALDRGPLLAECLAALWRRHRDLCDGRVADVADAWRRRAAPSLGRRVEWDADQSTRSGTALDIDESGALIVDTGSGTARVISGEVRWSRP